MCTEEASFRILMQKKLRFFERSTLLATYRGWQRTINTKKSMNQSHLAFEITSTAHFSDLHPGINDDMLVQNAQAGNAESIDCLLCKYLPDFWGHAQRACR